MGFLWHNCEPASLIMGDTGSLALGGALSLIAIMLGQQVLLFIIGGVFIIELDSSFIQQKYYRLTGGKRIFLLAPLHHHYEKKRDSGQSNNHPLLDNRHSFCPDRPCLFEDTIVKKAARFLQPPNGYPVVPCRTSFSGHPTSKASPA